MDWKVACLLLLSCFTGSYTQLPPLKCILITPSVLRADTDEVIVLDGHNSGFEATILVQDFPAKRRMFDQKKISADSKNDFLGTTTIHIKSQDLRIEPKRRYHVSIIVRSPQCMLEKVVLVTFQSGYIFIQTDKTIYTPGSKVLYRFYPLNYKMQSKKQTVLFEIKDPDEVIAQKDQLFPDQTGIISKSYDLPDLAKLGTWTISAYYDNAQEDFSAHFEVKEYVLPNFEVTIKPEKSFMYLDDESFSVSIESKYIYKKPVNGKAFVVFGLKKDDKKKILTDSLRRIEISNGKGEVQLLRRDLIKSYPNPEELLQYKLIVMVTVITDLGTDFVEAESNDIYIVKSPYKISFVKMSKYFKPGMPFDLTVMVTNPDGSPASGVEVLANPGANQGRTGDDGIVRFKLNSALTTSSMRLTVKTSVPRLTNELQATGETTLVAYKASSGQANYLHIGIKSHILEPKKLMFIDFIIHTSIIEVQKEVTHFTYLILSKGRIMKASKFNRTGNTLVSMPLFISVDLMPSFRIVAYYIIGQEIVSDSVWVDVVDSCMGTLTLEAQKNVEKPRAKIELTLKADYKSSVGLVAVDKGVFALNSKHKLTQRKVWDTVEKSDLGCSPGSGANNMGVFYDAGLAVNTNLGKETTERTDSSCKDTTKRKKRSSASLMEQKAQKASIYSDLEKQCCQDGMVSNPMGYSCERRAHHIQDGEKCKEAFLDCCRYIELKLKTERLLKGEDDLDRSDDDNEYMPDADILLRSDFPESWLWDVVKMDKTPNAENISTEVLKNKYLKDSITTWELLAVSLSEDKGICVAKPYEIEAFKSFFIDLRLPYSVVRHEQVEIRAILYNYESKNIKVRVNFYHNPEFCSFATPTKPYTVVVEVKETSSFAVPFVIVPLTIGLHHIEVKASVYGEFAGDGIKKSLRVVPEGIRRTEIITTNILNPEAKNGEDVVKVPSLANKNIVPDSPIRVIAKVQGVPIAQFLEDAIDGVSLNHLIVIPSGCAEQNMAKMTPVVIATHYLDKTNQWDKIGEYRRAEAIQNIQTGYAHQVTQHRRPDSSFGSFPGIDSSSWLTAYVVKVFAMAKKLTYVGDDVLCGAVKWLILMRQKPDGMFQEYIHISSQYMKGGVAGSSDPDAAMTAFVVISLLESQQYCSNAVNNLQLSIDKALNFITNNYQNLRTPHSVAITSYALALAGRLRDPSKLLSVATDKSYWGDTGGSKIVSIEATSYALLTLLKLEAKDAIDPAVRWLTEQRFYGETTVSTQATMMMFQALAQYQLAKDTQKVVNMDVTFQLPGRRDRTNYRINIGNILRPRSEETSINQGFEVKATGHGQASLTVLAVYYEVMAESEKECKNFDLTVTVANETNEKSDELETVSLNICFKHKGEVDATMSIIDVSMMTGFSPNEKDLQNLMNRVDKYISYFEINKGVLDKGSLIIYLNKVSHTEEECLKFRLNKQLNVGLVQPGSVTIYEYYSPENGCHKYYHNQEDSKLISLICHENVCRCATGNCLINQDKHKHSAFDRMQKACEAGMDYVYKISLLKAHYGADFDQYDMHIKEIFKRGADEDAKDKVRKFVSHIRCRKHLNLEEGKDYLVFGSFKSIWNSKTLKYTYILGRDTWIEWWPNKTQCQDPKYTDLCDDFNAIVDDLEIIGCQT